MILKELLTMERFRYLTLLNDQADLNRQIITVESSETPDAQKYISDNALLITTAMYFQEDQKKLIPFIQSLADKNCAGIAIKVSRFLKTLDQEVIDCCNQLKFPLLLIPHNKTLGSVYQDFITELWQYSENDLAFALSSQKVFTNILLRKPNLRSILSALRNILGVDVALIDPFGNIEQSSQQFSLQFSKATIRQAVRRVQSMERTLYQEVLVDHQNKKHEVLAHQIKISVHHPYYLLIMNPDKLRYPISTFIIEQAIFAIAFTTSRNLMNRNFELQNIERNFLDFIHLIEHGDEESVLRFAQEENIQHFQKGRTVLLHLPDFHRYFPYHVQNEGYTLLYNWLEKKFSKNKHYLLFPLPSKKYFLLQTPKTSTEEIIRDLKKITSTLKNILGFELQITLAPNYYSYKEMGQSFNESLNAVNYGIPHESEDLVVLSRPQNYKKLFAHIPQSERDFFCKSVLKDLYLSEQHNYQEYRKTLKQWLLNKCNIQKTAEDLYIHRNTVNYRLDKCREILDSNLDDPQELFNLEIALTLR